jgi:membrane-associated protease RseP (regulator of RpoE activity)
MLLVDTQTETFTQIVERYIKIEDITAGDAKQNYLVRYRGELYGDSVQAYDELAAALKPYDITPLFRKEREQAVILLMSGTLNPGRSNLWYNVIFFALTVISVLIVGALTEIASTYQGAQLSGIELYLMAIRNLGLGLPYATALLSILLAHEFGHYIAGRLHHTHVTLPYFIPLPIPPLGTMGAAIRMKEPPKNKRILLDIGLAGPVAGLVVAIPILIYGLSLSRVESLPNNLHGLQFEGNSILYLLAKYLVFGQWLPKPIDFGGLPPLLYWIRYFFTGSPAPLGGMDVMISPIAWAGWVGLLVTSLNLIPAGQLDGGHMVYTLVGSKKAKTIWPFLLIGLFLLGFIWSGWWLWAVLVFFIGRMYAEPLDQITSLNTGRKALAILALVIFVLVFMPVPIKLFY